MKKNTSELLDQLIKELEGKADFDQVRDQLLKRGVESLLKAEMTAHLGHHPGASPESENIRNGYSEKTIKTSKPANMFDNDLLVQHIYLENGTPEGIVLWYTLVSLHENSQTLKRLLADLECDISKEPETYDIPIEEDTSHTFAIYTSCKL